VGKAISIEGETDLRKLDLKGGGGILRGERKAVLKRKQIRPKTSSINLKRKGEDLSEIIIM